VGDRKSRKAGMVGWTIGPDIIPKERDLEDVDWCRGGGASRYETKGKFPAFISVLYGGKFIGNVRV